MVTKKTPTPAISFLLSLLLLEKDELDWFTATFQENILHCTFTKEMNLHFPTHEFARASKCHTTYPNLKHLLKPRHCLSVQIEMLQHLVPLMGPMSRTHQPSSGQPVHGQINTPLEALSVPGTSQSASDQCLMLSQCLYESFRV